MLINKNNMKTLTTRDIVIATVATVLVVSFVIAAGIHIYHLTAAGLIDWTK